ncbi:MAG: hypothetical protein C0392_05075 [Syntrophus sp. (in: bacteria)]|nr:hypothetical protein [Syntrophus sp. (in: bacteria)]
MYYPAAVSGAVSGCSVGLVLDVGPFAGVIFDLKEKGVGTSFAIAAFPRQMSDFFQQELKMRNEAGGISLIETDPALACIRDNTVDLLVFRGALFFPSLFHTDLAVMYRVLKAGGIAFVGGGFGKYTPSSIIEDISAESRDLNLKIGKTSVTADEIWRSVRGREVEAHMEIITEGGLWVVIRK